MKSPVLLQPFVAARQTLGVTPDDDEKAIKRAYRRATLEHPPDRDPEGFDRVRKAYELLSDPVEHARTALLSKTTTVPAPAAARASVTWTPRALAVVVLRQIVGRLDARELGMLGPNPDGGKS